MQGPRSFAPSPLAAPRGVSGQEALAFTADGSAESMALRSGLDRLLLAPSWRNADWGVLVVSLDRGDTLYAIQPDVPLAPASNAKLLTTAAALEALGPDYRFLTYLMTDGTVSDGVLEGDLILYGTGDPGLSSRFYPRRDEVFQRLIHQLEELRYPRGPR